MQKACVRVYVCVCMRSLRAAQEMCIAGQVRALSLLLKGASQCVNCPLSQVGGKGAGRVVYNPMDTLYRLVRGSQDIASVLVY